MKHLAPHNNSTWADPAKVDRLRDLWASGHSASQVARMLGGFEHYGDGGRSAIMGKVHRLGLPGRPNAVRTKGLRAHRKHNNPHPWNKAKPAPRPKPVSPVRAILCDGLPIPTPAETDIPRISFVDLESNHCRFICVDDVRDRPQSEPIFCGAEKLPGLSYCRDHAKRTLNLENPLRQVAVHPRELQVA